MLGYPRGLNPPLQLSRIVPFEFIVSYNETSFQIEKIGGAYTVRYSFLEND